MTRQDFIQQLRIALSGKMNSTAINENVQYYEDYINTQIRNGKAEEAVLSELGDPRLIAKSIVEAGKNGQTSDECFEKEDNNTGTARFPRWILVCTILLIVVFLIGLLFSALVTLLPVIIPIVAVIFIIRYFQKNG